MNRHMIRDIADFTTEFPKLMTDIERAITELHASRFLLAYATTGLGAILPTLIWGMGGCSRTLLEGLFTYDRGSTDDLVGRPIVEGYSSPTTASGMSAGVLFFNYQRLFALGRSAELPNLIGAAMCGAVQTCRSRRGADVAEMSFRVLRNGIICEWSIGLELKKEKARGWQDLFACLVFLNGVLSIAGIEQIKIPAVERFTSMIKNCKELVEENGLLKTVPCLYAFAIDTETLLAEDAIVINPDGSQAPLSSLAGRKIANVSTSANPLSPLHFILLREGVKAAGDGAIPVLELNAGNPDKGTLDVAELARRAGQAHGLCHVIVRMGSGRFIDKVKGMSGILPDGQDYVVGIDTAERILNPKYYGGEDASDEVRLTALIDMLSAFSARNVVFYVVERCGYTTKYDDLFGKLPNGTTDMGRQIFRQLFTGTASCAGRLVHPDARCRKSPHGNGLAPPTP